MMRNDVMIERLRLYPMVGALRRFDQLSILEQKERRLAYMMRRSGMNISRWNDEVSCL